MLKSTIARLALMLALPAVVLVEASSASANVRTTRHGASCAFSGYFIGGDPATLPPNEVWVQAFHEINGAFFWSNNQVNLSSHAVCSLDRALPLSTAGFSDIEVRLRPLYSTIDHNITCSVMSFRPDGTVIDADFRSVLVPATGASTPAVLLDFGSAIGATASKGVVSLDCGLRHGVSVSSYYFSENDGVSGN